MKGTEGSLLPRRWAALFAGFLVTGVAMATWVSRDPAIRDATGSGPAEKGVRFSIR